MSYLTVIKERCCGKGGCAAVCPIGILKMDPNLHIPVMVEGGEKACIKCGHCVAVCPYGVLSIEPMPADKCKTLSKDWIVPPEKLEEFLKARRSVREYKENKVDRAVIEKLIDTARYAPTGINRQPVYWAVIYDGQKVKELSRLVVGWMRALINEKAQLAEALHMDNIVRRYDEGNDPINRGAPHVVLAYALREDMTAPQACTIAMTYLELQALSFGLGACWAGYVAMAANMSPEVQKFIGLSKKTQVYGAMMLGYPKYKYARIPLRNDPHVIWR